MVLAEWCITQDYPRKNHKRMSTLVLIEIDNLIGSEFRIYVEQTAESSDVRPVGRRHYYVRELWRHVRLVDNSSEEQSTANDRVDDRVFEDPFDPATPLFASLIRSSIPGGSQSDRSS